MGADVPGDVTTSEVLDFDVAVDVTLGSLTDSDWYAVTLTAGQSYSIRLGSDYLGVECNLYDAAGHLLVSGLSDNNENYWYTFAGYFARSRCAILMTSLPTDRLADFCTAVDSLRARWPGFPWGAAVFLSNHRYSSYLIDKMMTMR